MTREVAGTHNAYSNDASEAPISRIAGRLKAPCAESIGLASRELAALVAAVTQLFGSEEARRAAEDWLDGLLTMLNLPAPTIHCWRQITVAVAARLAARVSASPRQIQPAVCSHFEPHSEGSLSINPFCDCEIDADVSGDCLP